MFDLFKKKQELKKEESKPEIKKDIRPIVTNLAELRKPCLPVEKGEDIKEIIRALKDTLEAKKGLGITANQIGINKKISYIKIPKFIDKNKKLQYNEYIFINAKIIEKDRPVKIQNESCISFPGVNVTTRRYVFITVEYLDENLKLQTGTLQDVESLVVQHELDHQLGIVLFDRKWRNK
jgi:peptide deformylase